MQLAQRRQLDADKEQEEQIDAAAGIAGAVPPDQQQRQHSNPHDNAEDIAPGKAFGQQKAVCAIPAPGDAAAPAG
ncbi:hypothetical protein D3C74_456010 [compost metagenome]